MLRLVVLESGNSNDIVLRSAQQFLWVGASLNHKRKRPAGMSKKVKENTLQR